MKNVFTLACLWIALLPAFGQKLIEKNLPFTAGQKVDLNFRFADSIQVQYWDKNEVSLKIAVEINNGRLNDALLVKSSSGNGYISVQTDFDKEMIRQGKPEDCPGDYHSGYYDNGHRICSEIYYQVFIPRQAELRIETISGNIYIQGASGPVDAKSISGFVDMNWPSNQGATIAMKSISGELYSDLDIAFRNKNEKPVMVGYELKGTVNGGGPEVRLESISNNIYLRKKN